RTREMGLGGSDAAMVYKVGLYGLQSLTNTDKDRLAIMTGQKEFVPSFMNQAMENGHLFEDFCENVFLKERFDYEKEKLLTLKTNLNFSIFAHADFFLNGNVHECKCTKNSINKTIEIYQPQLQWYYLFDEVKNVKLIHHPQINENEQFSVENITGISIKRDNKIIDILINGINLLNDFVEDFIYEKKEELTEDDLLFYEKEAVLTLYNKLSEIKRMETEAEKLKSDLLQMMKTYGVKSIKSDKYTISYVPESETRTFDKVKFFKDHPEFSESDYIKISKKKDYLTIKLFD
ncbi:MAG TPA: hypothetical protein PLB74_02770, partial [Candidatus Paceibacterota bacterium]|nr:hypothetical protein [Candidatus Paceibacterota bacterium]